MPVLRDLSADEVERFKRAWWEEEAWPTHPHRAQSLTILDVDQPPEWTGLYDAQGRKLMRAPAPFGFRRA